MDIIVYDFYIAKSWTFKTNKFSAHNLETPFGEDNDLIVQRYVTNLDNILLNDI